MIVGEPIFLLCLIPVVVVFYALRPGLSRAVFLLAISYGFYSTYNWRLLPILLAISLIAYLGAFVIERARSAGHRSAALYIAVAICLSPLVFFKYLVPILSGLPLASGAQWEFTLAQALVPVGLSFYTFIAVGYLIDVYLEVLAAERNAIRFGVYVGFFAHVTSGPIARATDFLPQLDLNRPFRAAPALRALQEILVGAVMKFGIADTLSGPVNAIYQNPMASSASQVLLATLFFSFQLYTDFAGYSLVAIGAARLLGIELAVNFRQPYLSATIQDFWRSWHMSLFSWLRDYVFTPLRMQWRKAPRLGMNAAMFLTLVLVGIWHGVGWGFIVFGAVHGVLMIVSAATLPRRNALWARAGVPLRWVNILRIPGTFLVIMLTMVLLRSKTLSEAIDIYRGIFSAKLFHQTALMDVAMSGATAAVKMEYAERVTGLVLVALVVLGDAAARSGLEFARQPGLVRAALYSAMVLAVLYQAVMSNGARPFIYLQF